MPIPGFNNQGVLPPYDGDTAHLDNSSPYPATTFELCQKLGTTPERREILRGFLKFRGLLHDLLVVDGFQWVDGRFMEKDPDRGSGPDCIQVVTFCKDGPRMNDSAFDELSAPLRAEFTVIRKRFRVDPLHVCLDWPLDEIIANTRFYSSLMSHQQETGIWKGMLEIKLATPNEDARSMEHLNSFGDRAIYMTPQTARYCGPRRHQALDKLGRVACQQDNGEKAGFGPVSLRLRLGFRATQSNRHRG